MYVVLYNNNIKMVKDKIRTHSKYKMKLKQNQCHFKAQAEKFTTTSETYTTVNPKFELLPVNKQLIAI